MTPSKFAIVLFSVAAFSAAGCASKRPAGAAQTGAPTGSAGAGAGFGQGQQPGTGPYDGAGGSTAVGQAEMNEFATAIGDRVYFALDSHTLTGEAQAALDRQAQWLMARPNLRVLVAGHADERGTREYNLALGSRRAAAARDHLVSRGIPSSRIDTVSYGKERPVDSRSNEEGWARNRNAHTVLLNGQPLA
jgi:peptidoglycan-associated lipoprotein